LERRIKKRKNKSAFSFALYYIMYYLCIMDIKYHTALISFSKNNPISGYIIEYDRDSGIIKILSGSDPNQKYRKNDFSYFKIIGDIEIPIKKEHSNPEMSSPKICKGSVEFGTGCGKCKKCLS